MFLAELLSERAEAQRSLEQLRSRVAGSARVREDEEAEESAVELLAEARQVVRRVGELSQRINRCNAAVEVSPGVTIADAIVQREALVQERKVVVAAAEAASVERGWGGRSTKEDLRWKSLLPVAELRAEAGRLAKAIREVDVQLQRCNWTVEV